MHQSHFLWYAAARGLSLREVFALSEAEAFELFREVRPPEKADYHLTPHEQRLLGMLVDGHNYKTAADELGVSVNTVSFHMKHVYEKLQVHSKSEAVAKALRDHLVERGFDREKVVLPAFDERFELVEARLAKETDALRKATELVRERHSWEAIARHTVAVYDAALR